jgi:hypothetical protein
MTFGQQYRYLPLGQFHGEDQTHRTRTTDDNG